MSVRAMHWVWTRSRSGPTERLVLLAIADAANDRDEAWPSMAALVEKTGLSERTVQRCVSTLVNLGELSKAVGGGRGKTTKYRLLTMSDEPETPTEKPRNPDPRQENPVSESVNPVSLSENPVTVSPGTIKNRQEPKKTPTGSSLGTRIPDDFAATADMIAWAREHTPLVGAKETEAFVDYWRARPGVGGRKLDWIATWRTWMRRAQADAEGKPARASPNGHLKPNTVANIDLIQRASEWDRQQIEGAK